MDFLSTIDWQQVIQALLMLVAAIFGTKVAAEKMGVRLPVLSKPTETERRLKLVARLDGIYEQLGYTPEQRKKRVAELTAPTATETPAKS